MKAKEVKGIATATAVLAVAVVAGYAIYTGKKTVTQARQDLQNINPVNDKNIINRGVSAVVSNATDGKHDNLGSWFYCLTHPNAPTCNPNYKPPLTDNSYQEAIST